MDKDIKAEFINGEVIVHSPALEKRNAAVLRPGVLLSVFVDAGKVLVKAIFDAGANGTALRTLLIARV